MWSLSSDTGLLLSALRFYLKEEKMDWEEETSVEVPVLYIFKAKQFRALKTVN